MAGELHQRPEDLLTGHVEWVRALARRLAADPDSAEDLAQDALVVALRGQPRDALRFRPWIAAVLRNLARQGARGTTRREAREELAARPAAVEPTDALVEQVVLGRELAQAVLDLPEPYRTVLILRFWEGLPPREIARRTGAPVATVNSRITRALAQIRVRLEHERGGRASWLSALAPLLETARPGSVLPHLAIGGIVVNAKIVLSALAGVALAAVLWGISATRASEGNSSDVAVAPVGGTADAPRAELATQAGGAPSERVAPAASAPVSQPVAAAQPEVLKRVTGRVLDVDGLPLSGLTVGQGDLSARAGGAGRFELETSAASVELSVLDPGWTTVRAGSWHAGAAIEPIVVAGRSLDVRGEVVDPRGEPLQDARVQLVMPSTFGARFDESLEASRGRGWSATTDAHGRFAFPGLPRIGGAKLRAVLEGWGTRDVPAPEVDDVGLRIELARPSIPLVGALRGRVLDERGDPLPQARVFLGLASTLTDDRGRFGLELARAVTADRIVAVKGGHRSAALDRPREPRGTDTGWPDEVELVLAGPPLTIRGVVRTHDGKPKAGARVSLSDPTPIGTIGMMPANAEGIAAGMRVPPQAIESESQVPETDGDNYYDQFMRVGPPTAFWNFAQTDAEGRFEIGGLDDRTYRLRVVDPVSLCGFTSTPIDAGSTTADLKLPVPVVWPELIGTVVDDAGKPVAGVDVLLVAEAYGVKSRIFGGRTYISLRDRRENVVTDEKGRFTLRDVPREGMELNLSSESTVPHSLPLERGLDPAQVLLEVSLRCAFEVHVAPGGELDVDAIALRDAQGQKLDVLRIEPGHVNAYTAAPLVDGRTGVLSASSAARTLVLLRNNQVVREVPIRLRGGETNLIEL